MAAVEENFTFVFLRSAQQTNIGFWQELRGVSKSNLPLIMRNGIVVRVTKLRGQAREAVARETSRSDDHSYFHALVEANILGRGRRPN